MDEKETKELRKLMLQQQAQIGQLLFENAQLKLQALEREELQGLAQAPGM